MIAAASSTFAFGALVGFGVGLLAGPAIRSWLAWREAEAASREAGALRRAPDRTPPDRVLPMRPEVPPATGTVAGRAGPHRA